MGAAAVTGMAATSGMLKAKGSGDCLLGIGHQIPITDLPIQPLPILFSSVLSMPGLRSLT